MGLLVQKWIPALRLADQRLVFLDSKRSLFSGQGNWDSGCVLHVTAMLMALLGKLTDPQGVSSRKSGPEAQLWRDLQDFYFTGISLDDLWHRVYELNWGLRPVLKLGKHRDVLSFCEREILAGRGVILSWTTRLPYAVHAVLAVGLEGRMIGQRFEPETLLILDPSEPEPWMTYANARLIYSDARVGDSRRYARYISQRRFDVTVDSALSIRLKPP